MKSNTVSSKKSKVKKTNLKLNFGEGDAAMCRRAPPSGDSDIWPSRVFFHVLPSVSPLRGSLLLLSPFSSLPCGGLWRPLVPRGAPFWPPRQSAGCLHDHRTRSSTRTTIFLDTASTSSCMQEIECGPKLTHCFPLLASLYHGAHRSHLLLSVFHCSLGLSVP